MRLGRTELRELAALAAAAAREAGAIIAESRPLDVRRKAGDSPASQVVTEIDRRSEDLILRHLAPSVEQYRLGLLTEERLDDGSRFAADYFWCVDPLDGTLPFVEGVPGYAVSIALVANDGTPVIGAVHDPVEGRTVHAIAGAGAFENGEPWQPVLDAHGDTLMVFADRRFPDTPEVEARLNRMAESIGCTEVQVRQGAGAVMNALGVLGHPPACYLKFPKPSGGGSLWDFAATACIFSEVGAIATDIHGEPLDLNRPDSTYMNHHGVLFSTHHL